MKIRIAGLMFTISSTCTAHSNLDTKQAMEKLEARISMLQNMIQKKEVSPSERAKLQEDLRVSENTLKSLTSKPNGRP